MPSNAFETMNSRTRGLILLLGGLVLGYFGYLNPIQSAQNHAKSVLLPTIAPILAPVASGLGLAFIILGDRFTSIFGTHKKFNTYGWLLCGALFVLGGAGYFQLRHALGSYGYRF